LSPVPTRHKAAQVPLTEREPQPYAAFAVNGAGRMEAPMNTMLVLDGLAILAVVVLVIGAKWQRLTTDPEEDAV